VSSHRKPSPAWLDDEAEAPCRPEPAWVRPGGDRAARTRRSRKNEHELGARLGGRRLPASGGRPWSLRQVSLAPGQRRLVGEGPTARGDVSIPGFLVELKETEAQSIRFKRAWVEKVVEGASARWVQPAVVVRFLAKVGEQDVELVVLPQDVYERVLLAAGGCLGDCAAAIREETRHRSRGLKREWAEEVVARSAGVAPALALTFRTPGGEDDVELVVLPMDVFVRLLRGSGRLEDE